MGVYLILQVLQLLLQVLFLQQLQLALVAARAEVELGTQIGTEHQYQYQCAHNLMLADNGGWGVSTFHPMATLHHGSLLWHAFAWHLAVAELFEVIGHRRSLPALLHTFLHTLFHPHLAELHVASGAGGTVECYKNS